MVSNNLLDYTIQNTVMNTSIKQPRMVNPGTEQTFIRQQTDLGGLEVHTTDGIIEVDTTAARESLGLGHMSDASMIKHYVEVGKKACEKFTRRTAQDGDALVRKKATRAQLTNRHYVEDRLPEPTGLAFIPSAPAELNAKPGKTDISHHPTEVNIDWANTGIVPYQLDRGTVTFDIVQKAYVSFQYMGKPNFFPDPEFQSWA